MDLSWLLTTASLLVLAYAGFTWLRGQLPRPRRESVKNSPARPVYKLRSRGSRGSNAANAGSAHREAVQAPVNVPANVRSSPAIVLAPGSPAAPSGALAITPNELQQLAAALAERAGGATVEEAVFRGFGVKKGGGAGYKRARELFDAATSPPMLAR